jgi:DNA-binding Lrp family transcriptional regulator
MDKIDLRLLYEINWDCRQTDTSLGKKLRISKQVVNYRIKRLEEQGLIQGYNALIDWRKLGYNALRVYLDWRAITPEQEQAFIEEVRQNPLFMWTVQFKGDHDFGFYIWTKDIPSFAEKWFEFLGTYRALIRNYVVYESVQMTHYPLKVFYLPAQIEEKTLALQSPEPYDEIDYEILKLLSNQARLSMVDAAKEIKLTPKAVIERVHHLEKKGIIRGYNAIINTEKLGYTFYKVDFTLNTLAPIKEMIEFAKQHPNITYLMRTIGGPDYEIEVVVKSSAELVKLINEIRTRFAKDIESYTFRQFERTIKQVYLPGVGGNQNKKKS